MANSTERGFFSSRVGIILATAGSAVGLGNVWRFPFMTGQNGGAAFIVLYIGCIFLLGIPGMVSEFIVGRRSHANAAHAYQEISGKRSWGLIGYLGILTSSIILGFYAVVAGWCLQYLGVSISGELHGDTAAVANYFQQFSSHPVKPALLGVVFILITHFIVSKGIQGGIERASKLLMPLLFASCSLPGSSQGIEFLLRPDFSKVSGKVMLEALGQAFFSLSLGTACLCTYASYFAHHTPLLRSAVQVAIMDTIIAILAGLMIFPAAFSVGVQPDSGPSLIFITLPNVFQQAFSSMPVVGWLVSIMFYALLVFAAMTSTISMHEIGTAFFSEKLKLKRQYAAWIVTVSCCILCVCCALSVGNRPGLQLFHLSLMEFCDYLTAQFMLPAGAFLTSILLGWFVPKHILHEEFTNHGTLRTRFFQVYLVSVRYVVPCCILLIFLHQFGVL
jgi:NSS family neurotransmitter:Na+ symporter